MIIYGSFEFFRYGRRSWDSSVVVVTKLRSIGAAEDFSLFHRTQTVSDPRCVTCSMGRGILFPGGLSGRRAKLTALFHILPGV